MDIVSDTYIRGGIPQSRYCRSCAHYQVLSGCSSGSNCTADSEKRTTRDRLPLHPRYRAPPRMLARPWMQ